MHTEREADTTQRPHHERSSQPGWAHRHVHFHIANTGDIYERVGDEYTITHTQQLRTIAVTRDGSVIGQGTPVKRG